MCQDFSNLCFKIEKDGEEEECYLTAILCKDRSVEGFILA